MGTVLKEVHSQQEGYSIIKGLRVHRGPYGGSGGVHDGGQVSRFGGYVLLRVLAPHPLHFRKGQQAHA